MTDQLTQLTILRSSDAAKFKLNVALAKTTLAELKHSIAEHFNYNNHGCEDQSGTTNKSKQSKKKKKSTHSHKQQQEQQQQLLLPPPPPTTVQLRIFHLGRELKSGGRNLDKLGVGRYRNNTILHVHVVPPSSHLLLSSRNTTTSSTTTTTTMTTMDASPVIPTPWAGTSSRVAMAHPTTTTTIRMTTTATGKQVIELLDDSDDDDHDHADHNGANLQDHGHPTNHDDDDTSSVVEVSTPPNKRQRV